MWTGLGLNRGFRGETLAINRLSYTTLISNVATVDVAIPSHVRQTSLW
jgi:hypothetical protein